MCGRAGVRVRVQGVGVPRPDSSPHAALAWSPALRQALKTQTLARWRHGTAVMQGLLRDGRTSSTVNSPMEVVHLAVGLPDMVAKVARAMRAVEGTMRAVGLSARVAAENIISVSVSVIGGRASGG